MKPTEKKPSPPPVVQRANALLDRVQHLDGGPQQAEYQLDRPFDGAGAPRSRATLARASFIVARANAER